MDKDTILKLRKLCANLKVLYVEDDENISKQLERILNKIFTNIDIQTNGKAGLIKYKKIQHDIVITDILMPIMNGIEMSHHIKKINKNQMIIVTSAHSEMKYMSKLIDIGVNKFVLKPIDLMVFLELLGKVAIRIFKDRKENNQKNQKIKGNIFSGINNPIVITDKNKIKYVNDLFKKRFLKETDGEIEDFKLRYLFKDAKMQLLNNEEILQRIGNLNKVYELLHMDSKIYKTYKIDVHKMEDEEDQYLINFVNIDFVINDLEKSSINYISKFKTRRDFLEKMHLIYNNKERYEIFCFGLKNVQMYIKECGAKQMNAINNDISIKVKKEFSDLVKEKKVDLYLFNTNRYILIANIKENTTTKNQIEEKLKNFGTNYKCSNGNNMGYHLDYVVEPVNKELAKKDIIDNTEAMLYMLKD
nr:response regulator [uncultured Sulfurimonas sp.]